MKKKGKSYGPYIYESYRDENGKVKKRYLGKLEEKKVSRVFVFLIGFVGLLFLLSAGYTTDYFLNEGEISAKVVDGFTGFVVEGGDSGDDGDSGSSESVASDDGGKKEKKGDKKDSGDKKEKEKEKKVKKESTDSGDSSADDSPGISAGIIGSVVDVEEEVSVDVEVEEEVEEEVEDDVEEEVEEESEEVEEEVLEVNETIVEESNETEVVEVNETVNDTEVPEVNETVEVEVNDTVVDVNETILNETLANVTFVNETILNETVVNVTEFNVSVVNVSDVVTLQYKAVIHRPVKWLKKVTLPQVPSEEGNVSRGGLSVEIPLGAENISVLTDEEVGEAEAEIDDYDEVVGEADRVEIASGLMTGNVALEISGGEGWLIKFWNWLTGFTISGNVVFEDELEAGGNIVDGENSTVVDLSAYISAAHAGVPSEEGKVAVGYYTEAPVANETNLSNGKRVVVSAEDELNYTEILAYTMLDNLSVGVNDTRLQVYWYASEEDAIALGYLNASNVSEDVVVDVVVNESVVSNGTVEVVENVSVVENITEVVNETVVENESVVENVTVEVNESVEEINDTVEEINETVEDEGNLTLLISGNVVGLGNGSGEVLANVSNESIVNETVVENETVIENETEVVDESVDLNSSLDAEVARLLNLSETPDLENLSLVKIAVEYVAYDLDEDGFADYVEWVVPHLSVQTYEVVINE
ncbi:hypothetical protein HN935_00185, partial [archaeon]|nr:hypothetical protein [archaeon]